MTSRTLLAQIIKRSLISLLALYAVFLAVQLSHIFNQSPQLMITLGYDSFASYLHHGVAELIVVCIINMILMIRANHLPKETTTIKRLTTCLAIASLLIVICVNARLRLYISYYGLTFDRIIVQLMCLILVSYFGYISIRTRLTS